MYHGERFNAWSHLLGAVAACIGAVWMLVVASLDGSPWKIVSVAIYGFTLMVLYSASTVYHSVRGRRKEIMQKVDHFSIYLLIAGSYTPFCLVTLRGPWGWTLFGIVWGLAVIGILQEIKPRSEARILSIVIYAVMGWIVLVAVKPLLAALGTAGFIWLASGGVLYSASTVYHSVRGRRKEIMQKVDHFSIYLLIAGSYTPFCLVTLRGPWGWTLFGIVWGLALIGILQEIKPRSEARILSLVIYAVMGWIVLVAVKPLLAALGSTGFAWLASGGVLYTVGIVFFALDSRLRHAHGIWHLFVIAGSLLHFVAIMFYVL